MNNLPLSYSREYDKISEHTVFKTLNFLSNEIGFLRIDDIVNGTVDKRKHYVYWNAVLLLRLDLIPWSLLPPDSLERIGAYRYSSGSMSYPDYGIDCASIDIKTTCQTKWRSGSITFRELGTFYTYSKLISAEKLLLVANQEAKLHSLAMQLVEKREIGIWCHHSYDMIRELCEMAVGRRPIAFEIDVEGKKRVEGLLDVRTKDVVEDVKGKGELIELEFEEENVSLDMQSTIDNVAIEKRQNVMDTRPYQKECLAKIYQAINAGTRDVRVRMCCGSGKKYHYRSVLRELQLHNPSGRYLLFVTSKLLMYAK